MPRLSVYAACAFFVLFVASCGRPALDIPKDADGRPLVSNVSDTVQPKDLAALSREASRQEVVEGNLKKGNIDFSQSTIQYYSGGGETARNENYPPEKEPLAIVDFSPTGELPIEVSRPTIYVMFNHPIVPLTKLGEPITETPLMKIDPPAKGVFRWYGTKVLSFQPDGALIDNPLYTVTVSGNVQSLGGNRLGKDFTFEFHTEAVKIVNFYPGRAGEEVLNSQEVPVKQGRFMIAEFNQEVDADHIKQFISIAPSSTNKPVSFSIGRPNYSGDMATRTKRAVQITLNSDPPENVTVALTLADKATPRPKYPGRNGPQTVSFHTVRPFMFNELTSYNYDIPRNNTSPTLPVYANFSHPVESTISGKKFKVWLNNALVKPVSIDLFDSTIRFNIANAKPRDEVKIQAPADLHDAYGRVLNNATQVRQTTIPDAISFFTFPEGLHHLEASFPPKFLYAGRNVDSLAIGMEAKPRYSYDLWTGWDDRPIEPEPVDVDLSKWQPNKAKFTLVDLKPFLNSGGFGTVYFTHRGTYPLYGDDYKFGGASAIQVTDLGITSRIAYNRVLVWVNSLSTGLPVADARVELSHGPEVTAKTGKTNADGFVEFGLKDGEFSGDFQNSDGGYFLGVAAIRGKDRAEMRVGNSVNSYTATTYSSSSPIWVQYPVRRLLMFTDRGLYKPGEELALRGISWVQSVGNLTPYAGEYSLKILNPRDGSEVWSKEGKTSASGGFAQKFNLPDDLEPGEYTITYDCGDGTQQFSWAKSTTTFTIAQFRKLSFQVKSSVPQRTYFLGDTATVGVSASYLAGGNLPGADYRYFWTRKPVPFTPPGPQWVNYVFGPGNWEGEKTLEDGKGKLTGTGTASVGIKTGSVEAQGAAYSYALETTVQDLDRQEISSTAHVLVHPSSFYIGARFGTNLSWWGRFVATGQNTTLGLVLVDPEGKQWSRDQEINIRILRGDWKMSAQQGVYGRINNRWDYVETEISTAKVRVGAGKGQWDFSVADAGDYLLSAEGKDAQGRITKTVIRFYATGSNWVRKANASPSTIELINDKSVYSVGDTAHILVRSPIPEGKYLLTFEREGIFEDKLITLKGGQSLIDVPILDKYVPVFYVALTSFTKREASPTDFFEPDLGKPRSLFGVTGLKVDTKPRELDISIEPLQKAYKPGTKAEVKIRVTQGGQPVPNTEITAIAVDRGVLDLIDYHVPDPVAYFYDVTHFPLAVDGDDSRRLLLKPVTYDTTALTGGDAEKLPERKDFRPLALFEPFVKTDKNGEATVTFKLPDSLTTYRVTALGVQGARVGIKEGEIMVQNPVNVRTALPRRFRNRDTAAAGVVLTNLTGQTQKVQVTAASTILTVGGDATKSVDIPAFGVYELPFILSATTPGEGTITFTIKSDVLSEKLTEKVFVDRPLITEAFSTVGNIPRGETAAKEGLLLPSLIAPGYGSLTVSASSTLRSYIEPSLRRLKDLYWQPWSDYDLLLASFAFVYDHEDANAVNALSSELGARQQPSGGIYAGDYQRKPYVEDPYISLLVAHFMEYCASRKQALKNPPNLDKLLAYLGEQQKKFDNYDGYYHAYNNYVLAAGGHKDGAYLKKTEDLADSLGLGGYGLLAQAHLAAGDKGAAERVYKRAKNFMMIGTQTVDVRETYEVKNYWSSLNGEIGLLLRNAFQIGEDTGLVQRIAGTLNKSMRHWQSSNDDLWTLLGFMPILDAEGARPGEATVKLSIDTKPLGTDFSLSSGASQDSKTFQFGGSELGALQRNKLLSFDFAKTQGDTPVYYTMILRYALPNESAFARDEGIEVHERYETLDGTTVDEKSLKLGETYRITVDLSSTKRRARLELKVPIPSGLEIVDPTFVTNSSFANKGGNRGETITRETVYGDTMDVVAEGYATWNDYNWEYFWYTPDVFALDNMMVYRWTDFYEGSRSVSFLVRVTTPGIYPTPPAGASLEFEPEVFGRSDGKLFVIKP